MASFASQISSVLLFLLFTTIFNSVISCNESDERLLLIFKQGVVDPNNQLSSWTTEEDCCLWEGVHCNNMTGRVTELSLFNHTLRGDINLCVLQLEFLNHLDLSHNDFKTVSMPPCQISKSPFDAHKFHNKSLATPSNHSASFSVVLQSNRDSKLVDLDLSYNHLRGALPDCWANWKQLRFLNLGSNMLTGAMPHCLYNIMQPIMEYYPIHEIEVFAKGRELDYKNFREVHSIDLSTNNLSGEIPKELFKLVQLRFLNLSRNHFTGKIPEEIGGMKDLESFHLSYNKLSGEIPSTISNLSFLDYLNLSYNDFTGQIPLGTQIQSFDPWSFVGNDLCGDPLPKKCYKKEACNDSKPAEGNEDDDFLKSLYLGMGVGFATGSLGVCGSLFLIRAWRRKFFQLFHLLADRLYVIVALKLKKASNEY
ncbi:polygalacturonase inhibitor-like [Neltuma alba]|uniref:polygalacturonase inhibitor-like n=1 Tax=Neltuma alba TaxID=207710 RepID=UPI0010A35936|nr:polygalacturonase inhibitor-like [Prosopis alba]